MPYSSIAPPAAPPANTFLQLDIDLGQGFNASTDYQWLPAVQKVLGGAVITNLTVQYGFFSPTEVLVTAHTSDSLAVSNAFSDLTLPTGGASPAPSAVQFSHDAGMCCETSTMLVSAVVAATWPNQALLAPVYALGGAFNCTGH
ncbi:MAG: hypothetical protein WDW38_001411 [Sanguina aurantia]